MALGMGREHEVLLKLSTYKVKTEINEASEIEVWLVTYYALSLSKQKLETIPGSLRTLCFEHFAPKQRKTKFKDMYLS